jgi:hypothetical protein
MSNHPIPSVGGVVYATGTIKRAIVVRVNSDPTTFEDVLISFSSPISLGISIAPHLGAGAPPVSQ